MAETVSELMPKAAEGAGEARGWRPYQVYLMGLVLLVAISSQLDQKILSTLQEPIKADLRLSDTELGLISGPAFVLFYSLAGLPIARIAERLNRTALLGVFVAAWSAMTMFCGVAQNLVQLALARVGVGMAEGGNAPVGLSFVADSFSVRQRGFAMSIHALAAPIAGILAPVVAGLVAARWGWRAAFLVVGLPGFLFAVLCFTTLKDPRSRTGAAPRKVETFLADIRWLFSNRAFLFVFIAGAFNGIGIQGTGIFSTSFVMREHGLTLASAGMVVGLFGVVRIIGTFIGGWLADVFGDDRGRSYVLVPAAGAALSFVFYLVSFNAPTWPLAITCLLAANVAADLKNGPNQAAVQNIVPNRMRATAAAVFMLAAAVVGMAGGAMIVGGISDWSAAAGFPASLGSFTTVCPGGHAAHGAAAALKAACATASAGGLKTGLTAITFSFLGSMTFFYLASRTITVNRD